MIDGATNEVILTLELEEMFRVIDACKDKYDEFKFNLDDTKMIDGATNEVILTLELEEMFRVFDACKDKSDEFKFNLDDIWRPLGYSEKDVAVRALKKMAKSQDYKCPTRGRSTSRGEGQNEKTYLLSANGLEKLATVCGTEIGKQVREYLISLRHAA